MYVCKLNSNPFQASECVVLFPLRKIEHRKLPTMRNTPNNINTRIDHAEKMQWATCKRRMAYLLIEVYILSKNNSTE